MTTEVLAIFGATGSIGRQTLAVVKQCPERFSVAVLVANQSITELVELAIEYQVEALGLGDASKLEDLKALMAERQLNIPVHVGADDIAQLVNWPGVNTVVSAMVGVAGLPSTWAAAQAGKRILLANKESLVTAGHLLMPLCQKTGATLVPLDSEHNAIYQCLGEHYQVGQTPAGVSRMTLTASGGPFRGYTVEQLKTVTAAQALKHPTWTMGRKISIDSASMMNKGLELIEACWLFNWPMSQLDVLVHPQSIIHAMITMTDGAMLAELGPPDMTIPIAHALGGQTRLSTQHPPLTPAQWANLTFEEPDEQAFPNLTLAKQAFEQGPQACVALNAANEMAVSAFLAGHIGFYEMSAWVEKAVDWGVGRFQAPQSLSDIIDLHERVCTLLSGPDSRF